MGTAGTRVLRILSAALLGVAVAAAPVLGYAQGAGHGGGGGGGHAMGGGGAHVSGGHVGGGARYSGGPRYAYGGHYAPNSGRYAYGGARYGGARAAYGHSYPAAHYTTAANAHVAGSHYAYHTGTVYHPGWGWGHWHPWGGGYWHGGYWPYAYYYPGCAWFLPILPFGYATYWWGGVPYYYWNNLYYTYSPSDNGYVLSEPPPGEQGEGAGADQAGGESAGSGDVYLYPRNGQSDEQTQDDRYQCHRWAVSQTGFDPTRSQSSGDPADYRRAMIACLDARGYSAR